MTGMGWTCGTYVEERKYIGFLWRNLKEIDHLEETGVDSRI